MSRILVTVLAAACFVAAPALAQESGLGAGRIEVTAIPAGGMLFMESGKQNEPDFKGYFLGGAFDVNVNRWVGFELEVGGTISAKQNLTFNRVRMTNQKPPATLTYTGNIVVNPIGSDRPWVPYATAGIGGLTTYNKTATADVNLGVTKNESYLTGNFGGGVKWFATRHAGLRIDYRFIGVQQQDLAPAFFGREDRMAHRLYGALLLTY
jgi:hypothetical protein